MANVFMGALVATTLVTGVTAWSTFQTDAPAENRSLENQPTIAKWEVSRLDSDQICTLIHKIDIGKSGSHFGDAVKLSNQCEAGFPILAQATFISQDNEGNTSLKNQSGETLVEFASAEQLAQESIYPKSSMLFLQKR